MNNPYHKGTGMDATQGIGSVARPGISALDPVNGLPLSWNPGRDRGLGGVPYVASGGGDGLDWSDVRGLTIASGSIYSVRSGDVLQRVDFRGGRPVPGTVKVVEFDD